MTEQKYMYREDIIVPTVVEEVVLISWVGKVTQGAM